MYYNDKRLTKKQINIIFNLSEKLADNEEYNNNDLFSTHPISTIYESLSKGMLDITDEFEYSMLAELVLNSILNNDSYMSSLLIKKIISFE